MRWAWVIGIFVMLCGPAQAQLRATDGLAALEAGDAQAARAIWQPLAERGDVLAQYNLGVLNLREGGDALGWFTLAAEAGYLPAQTAAAGLLADAQDWDEAARWYAAAAGQGDAASAHSLGLLHDRGLLGEAARPQAERWYRAAAEAGHVPAQFALGALLTERGAPEAATWFQRAAEAGHLEAQFNHARALTESDPAAARDWYARAGAAGFGPASYNLALMQARGQGGAESFQAALSWAVVAQDQGFVQAATLIAALSEVMTPEAERMARDAAAACLTDASACPR
ncbi:tetratricopeptide repeat protein [Roseibaca sp. Y0-43]|uniref:tetratricopeptide repeat protein n=1 Tax=Roseibaca sp. Y0-43 TaxID=2816854 RepID=UPI001D0C1AA8|nr:tetratricopeptide repeat protein [Roseibaca sp. Y0-43]MCC1480204.1 sel1 repeat family protein [Roseibaca sp. Y0-43]